MNALEWFLTYRRFYFTPVFVVYALGILFYGLVQDVNQELILWKFWWIMTGFFFVAVYDFCKMVEKLKKAGE